ncbi:MAG: hypothetical protein A3I77_07010 [Gammaproteobacteria bacterium RIFCSPLOWO2_02_FULL_42_14]|nr:MAG: hypothetical protein A3B71_02845 [Gammaproteobacteria bacterium RIFCSPHIGHO2_02_FULL_42_43]OGT27752.1 MAG: hypothetical protein A2624_00805 [Gammaproteobacteria bacterium RIFCSPHIGHO2_01_FULL_42_8]OGT52005.1 MAG: hypothetical protein A3E54_04350 [Gammaproteobacteria bacterium RIFCSPHIGHO2_12_FULL_41_25]OGT61110.1 MAG: hypothetical protein A3I77_07010 [Gammaproteobacteria bacterium RIFCSPLOWO2_02_FULL_42_14]OGT87038.1 MAG: hypothetical protein A3G86_00730 [Gammaproteobacteria bacterium R
MIDATAGIFSEVVSYPFSMVWTAQQTSPRDNRLTFSQAFKATYSARNFYAGFSIPLASAIPATILYLFGKDIPLYCFGDTNTAHFLRGFAAQSLGMLVWAPAGRLIVSQQASISSCRNNTFNSLSILKKAQTIVKEQGVRGLYRGALPCYMNSVVLDTIGFTIQAQILKRLPEEKRSTIAAKIFAMCIGFGVGSIITTPFDVAITRMRAHETNPKSFPLRKFFPTFQTTYRELGFRGFCAAIPAHLLYTTLWYSVLPLSEIGKEKLINQKLFG